MMTTTYLKKVSTLVLSALFLVTTSLAHADEYTQNTESQNENPTEDGIKTLVLYLDNLGKFLGYNLESTDAPAPNNTLLTYAQDNSQQGSSIHKAWETLAYYSVFAAIPVNAFQTTLQAFTQDDYAGLNQWANKTFLDPSAYNDDSSQDSVAVVKDVDQKTYQKDPVTQANLNMVGIPDASFCGALSMQQNGQKCISQTTVLETLLSDIASDGILPGTDAVFTYDNTQKYLSQLNSNTLIAPMLYTSGGGGEGGNKGGLPTSSQEQQAADFIRYATGVGLTMPRVTRDDYDALWSSAYPITNGDIKKSTEPVGIAAQQSLNQYLTNLRIYAAQSSVASSNLYAILSKRMPQGTKENPSSQALNEFKMATWRLNNPDEKDTQKQWLDQINTASAATVQKEIAILLSEINYQMYLSRQQDERLLLTNSMILMQGLQQNKIETPTAEGVKNQEAPAATN